MKLGPVFTTNRGFDCIEFRDAHRVKCSLQQSSAIDDTERGMENPGSSFLWLGTQIERMHLSRDQVTALVGHLQTWLELGSLDEMSDGMR